jgi:hypothetical protein
MEECAVARRGGKCGKENRMKKTEERKKKNAGALR